MKSDKKCFPIFENFSAPKVSIVEFMIHVQIYYILLCYHKSVHAADLSILPKHWLETELLTP